MTYQQSIGVASDRVMAALVAGLEIEFGRGAGEALAERFLVAEACEFHWEARNQERWLGSYAGIDEDEFELDRIAIIGRLDRRWFVAVCIVDGDEIAHGMMARRTFGLERDARKAFADVR